MINVHRTPCSLFSRLLVVADARPLRTPCWWRLRLARMDSGSRRRSARCSVVTVGAPHLDERSPARDGEDRRWCVPPPALPLHAARPAIRSRPPNATRASVDPREGSSDRRASPTSCRRRSDCLPRSAVSANPHPDAAGRTTRSSPSSCGNDAGRHSAHRTAPTPNHHRRYLPAGPQTAGYAAKNPAATRQAESSTTTVLTAGRRACLQRRHFRCCTGTTLRKSGRGDFWRSSILLASSRLCCTTVRLCVATLIL